MTAEATRRNFEAYVHSHDPKYLAGDAVFTDMSTGQESRGREGVEQMLNWIYHIAFDAQAEITNWMADEEHGIVEGYFVGKHIGDFAGTAPTGRKVRVPLCVTYDLREGQITRGRIYMAVPVMMQQLGAMPQPVSTT